QAEDGIRDRNVTGVQTCALPIFMPWNGPSSLFFHCTYGGDLSATTISRTDAKPNWTNCGKSIGRPKSSNACAIKLAKKRLPLNTPTMITSVTTPTNKRTPDLP